MTQTSTESSIRGRPWEIYNSVKRSFSELWRDKAGLFSISVVALIVLAAVFGPMIWNHSAVEPELRERLIPPAWTSEGTWSHPLGTDGLGRDMVARLLEGARVSLVVSAAVVLSAGSVGVFLGMIAGYRGGWWDSAIMRVVDTQVAFPGLLLALTILSVLGPSMGMVIVVLAINGWMVYARITRGIVLGLKETPYVQAAETVGCPTRRILWRYLLPNLVSPLLTLATLEYARIILAEASLSYLGLGIQPPGASWGLMVSEGQQYISISWWVITLPGLAIAVIVLALNLMASWLRVVSDPQQREKRFIGAADHKEAGSV